ncbi:MAG: 23S rRNA (uridine(2552)-2'-O)-methyltransferase [Candidatus Hydrothermarchaeota archaeon]|nr:MAG: 23S rRNA (uridine(2552)-2'-O)-methyltransferase [Candidatus Hydrothermarchaeota archaeon]
MKKDGKDYYYKKAKKEKYRSRASYKLKQINAKYKLIKNGDKVLDLGAAPGGWTQVAREVVGSNGLVVAVDLQEIKSFENENIIILQGDFTEAKTLERIKDISQSYDVIISDASPKISGVWDIDHFRSIELCENVLKIAKEVLKPGGNLVVKVFQGSEIDNFIKKIRRSFKYVKVTKPKASRKKSSEVYVIGKGFGLS